MPKKTTIAIASDHAGLNLKKYILDNLKEATLFDLGPNNTDSVDFPDYAEKACRMIQDGKANRAILICGTGLGMSIAANKLKGIRAAHVESVLTAKFASEHNFANVLCIGERVTAPFHALEMVHVWLQTEFAGARHERRIEKISNLEDRS
jgi:ribose 5-phosphate isomerase B